MKKILLLLLISCTSRLIIAQTLATVPAGLRLLAPCQYTYGCAAASDGTIWFTEFNHRELRQINTDGSVAVKQLGIAGMFGLAIDASNNIFVGLDLGDTGKPGKILKITPAGTQSYIVTGITRPRQLAIDASGNVYFATESPSQITKWNKNTGVITVLASGLPSPAEGVTVAADGTVYFSEYGAPGSGIYGDVKKIATNGIITTVATNFWRARGLVINAANDYLYVCTESDRADHGNSGLLLKIKISDGSMTNALQGIDYPQFPSTGKDGRIFFAMTRDSWIGAYDPNATTIAAPWPADTTLKTGLSGGNWSTTGPGNILNLNLNNQVTMNGKIHAAISGGTVYGWVRIPANKFNLNLNELYTNRCDPEHPAPGLFQLPSITYKIASGSCVISALAVRGHVGQRWPMTNPGTCTESPAPGFSESPVAYLVYFAVTP
jgi:hypothetical protein